PCALRPSPTASPEGATTLPGLPAARAARSSPNPVQLLRPGPYDVGARHHVVQPPVARREGDHQIAHEAEQTGQHRGEIASRRPAETDPHPVGADDAQPGRHHAEAGLGSRAVQKAVVEPGDEDSLPIPDHSEAGAIPEQGRRDPEHEADDEAGYSKHEPVDEPGQKADPEAGVRDLLLRVRSRTRQRDRDPAVAVPPPATVWGILPLVAHPAANSRRAAPGR